MTLTSAQIAKQTEVLTEVKVAFNDGVVPVAPLLKALQDAQPNQVLQDAIAAWNNIVAAMNAGNTAAIRAALDLTAAMVPSDLPINTSPPLFSNDLSSDAIIQRDFAHAGVFYGTLPTVNNPSKWIDGMLEVPITATPTAATPGVNSGPGIGGTGCSWHWWAPASVQAMNELWCDYDFYIDPDVPAGFNEEGCKLPGLAGAWEQDGQWAAPSGSYGWFSARLWHRRPDGAGNCELAGYVYSARSLDAKNPFGEITPTGKMLKPGIKYKLGQHIKLNSQAANGTWNSDGIFEILLDGVVVLSIPNFKMRADPRATFQDFFVNIFHGGSQPVTAPIHYRIGKIRVDNKPLPFTPAPVITQGAVPAWRRGLPLNQWVDIPGTAPAAAVAGMGTFFDGSFSGQANDRVNCKVYLPASAGHAVSDDNYTLDVDLMADAPRWAKIAETSGARAPTDNAAYFPDSTPTGCHLYYGAQVVQLGGKPRVIRSANLAGSFVGNAPLATDAFDPATRVWIRLDKPPASQYKEWATALDARTGRIYVQDQGGMAAVLDVATGAWSQGFASNGWGYGWGGQVVDPVLDELLYDFGQYRKQGDIFEGLHLTRNVRITHPFTWVGTPARSIDPAAPYRAMIIQERNRCIYVVAAGLGQSSFNRLDLNTWQMTNVGTVPQPVTIYNRIEDFPALGGIAHFPAFGSPMRFYATEA